MDPLTPARRFFGPIAAMNTTLFPAGLLASCSLPSGPSVANHPSSSSVSGLVSSRRHTGGHPYHRGLILIRDQCVIWASPLPSRLATTTGRIAFANYGRVIHLPLLPTPSHDDAVTFGYEVQTQLRRGLAPRRHGTLASAL